MKQKIRSGLKTIWWNPEMVDGAEYDDDIPICPTTAKEFPKSIITWMEAKKIYRNNIFNLHNYDFFEDSYVCFYIDDYKFDTSRGIWFSFDDAFKILCHFKGIITPDFSTYEDFPESLKHFNTYRMRAFGYQCGKRGLSVINNVRGSEDDLSFCFKGIPSESIVSIGTVGSGLQYKENRKRFESFLDNLMETLHPNAIIVYGSDKYYFFDNLKKQGIVIKQYDSETAKHFKQTEEIHNDHK
ncbi:MAG: DUF4417 domain-containing protein [Erysipelotrichaceae bacterium]|nr:DUF4417 domain-containing protein [Erysipelotrichaceae bacterium]